MLLRGAARAAQKGNKATSSRSLTKRRVCSPRKPHSSRYPCHNKKMCLFEPGRLDRPAVIRNVTIKGDACARKRIRRIRQFYIFDGVCAAGLGGGETGINDAGLQIHNSIARLKKPVIYLMVYCAQVLAWQQRYKKHSKYFNLN